MDQLQLLESFLERLARSVLGSLGQTGGTNDMKSPQGQDVRPWEGM
jgi:hypothetical protein